jgi:hypothetical protein
MEKSYLYYNTTLQFRIEVLPDGKLGLPEKIGGWTTQINGYKSLPIQKTTWRQKKTEEVKKEKEVQEKKDAMKTIVSDVVYD